MNTFKIRKTNKVLIDSLEKVCDIYSVPRGIREDGYHYFESAKHEISYIILREIVLDYLVKFFSTLRLDFSKPNNAMLLSILVRENFDQALQMMSALICGKDGFTYDLDTLTFLLIDVEDFSLSETFNFVQELANSNNAKYVTEMISMVAHNSYRNERTFNKIEFKKDENGNYDIFCKDKGFHENKKLPSYKYLGSDTLNKLLATVLLNTKGVIGIKDNKVVSEFLNYYLFEKNKG